MPIVFMTVDASGRDWPANGWWRKPTDADGLHGVLPRRCAPAVRACWRSAGVECSRGSSPRSTTWASSTSGRRPAPAAARVCGERRFEIALIDVGIRNPEAVDAGARRCAAGDCAER